MNDLVVITDLATLEAGAVEAARAHPPMMCPMCLKKHAQVMDGFYKGEIRLYFNCPDCTAQAVVVHRLTRSDYDEMDNAGMTFIQRRFFDKAWIKLHSKEVKPAEIENKKVFLPEGKI